MNLDENSPQAIAMAKILQDWTERKVHLEEKEDKGNGREQKSIGFRIKRYNKTIA